MSNIGNLLNEAGTQMRKQQDATKHLTNKWNKTGLLEGIGHEYDKTGMAVLLENQARQLIDENSSTGTTTSSEQWSGVALPLVRRIFSEIAAKDFVSVQPMNLPSGLVFYLDFKYGSAEGINDGNRFTKGSDVFGNTSASGDPAGSRTGTNASGTPTETAVPMACRTASEVPTFHYPLKTTSFRVCNNIHIIASLK